MNGECGCRGVVLVVVVVVKGHAAELSTEYIYDKQKNQ